MMRAPRPANPKQGPKASMHKPACQTQTAADHQHKGPSLNPSTKSTKQHQQHQQHQHKRPLPWILADTLKVSNPATSTSSNCPNQPGKHGTQVQTRPTSSQCIQPPTTSSQARPHLSAGSPANHHYKAPIQLSRQLPNIHMRSKSSRTQPPSTVQPTPTTSPTQLDGPTCAIMSVPLSIRPLPGAAQSLGPKLLDCSALLHLFRGG
jgi:hypothetical protein